MSSFHTLSPFRGANKEKCWITMIARDLKIAYHLPIWMKPPGGLRNGRKKNGLRDRILMAPERGISADCKGACLIKQSSFSKWTLKTCPGVFPCHGERKQKSIHRIIRPIKYEMKGRHRQQLPQRILQDRQPIKDISWWGQALHKFDRQLLACSLLPVLLCRINDTVKSLLFSDLSATGILLERSHEIH